MNKLTAFLFFCVLATTYFNVSGQTAPPGVSFYLSGEAAYNGSFKLGNVVDFYNYRAAVISKQNTTYTKTYGTGYYQVDIGIQGYNRSRHDSTLYNNYGIGIGFAMFNKSDFVWADNIAFGQFLSFMPQIRMGSVSYFTSIMPQKATSQLEVFVLLSMLYGQIYQGEYQEVYGGGNPPHRDYSLSGSDLGADAGIGLSYGRKFRLFAKLKYRYLAIPVIFKDEATGKATNLAVSNTDTSPVKLDLSGYSVTVGLMF